MRNNRYILFIFIFLFVLFRNNLVMLINNFGRLFISYDDSLEINFLESEYSKLRDEYNSLIDFKSNIVINDGYVISNVYKNNYGFDKLIINGNSYKLNDEVLSSDGLIGVISNIVGNYSEITYIYDLNIPVRINNSVGKIVGKDSDNNLIVREIDNVFLNDFVYSINGSYIGRVIDIVNEDLGNMVIVSTFDVSNINYVLVRDC